MDPLALAVAVGTKYFSTVFQGIPAQDVLYVKQYAINARKKVIFGKVCQSKSSMIASMSTDSENHATLATLTSAATPSSLSKAIVKVCIKGAEMDGLVDSGSSESFIYPDLVKHHSLVVHHSSGSVSTASTSLSTRTLRYHWADITINP